MIEVSPAGVLGIVGSFISLLVLVVRLQRDKVAVQSQTVSREQTQDEAQNTVILRLIEVISTLNFNLTRFADNYEKNTQAQIDLSGSVRELVQANLEDRQFFRSALGEMAKQIEEIHSELMQKVRDG